MCCKKVEDITAGAPRKVWNGDEAVDEIEQGPGDDDAVINVQEKHDSHGGIAHA